MYHAVILAGGAGKRLWPESTEDNPKPFLTFGSNQTLLENAVQRVQPLVPLENIWIVTAKSMKERVRQLLPNVAVKQILAEPVQRSTAAAIGWAAAKISAADPDAVMFVLPSDHIIKPEDEFRKTLQQAAELIQAKPELLLTLGIKPTFPATSYGYIKKGAAVSLPHRQSGFYYADRFCEKPPLEQAEEYVRSGQYFWNAGIFIWKAETLWQEIHRCEAALGRQLDTIRDSLGSTNEEAVSEQCFAAMPNVSIDYAVMERAAAVAVVPVAFDWNDAGTWIAVDRIYADQRDADGNIAVNTKLTAVDSSNCTVRSSGTDRLVSLVGIQDTIVVQTADAVLIMKK
jgi:mannose-1-phosphate guanylyltransferase